MRRRSAGAHGLDRAQAVAVDQHELSAADLPYGLGAEQVECARLGGDDPVVAEAPERERAEAVRIAEGDQRAVGDRGHGVRALEPRHRRRHRLLERPRVVCDRDRDQLGVGGRGDRGAVRDELGPQLLRVDEIPVVRERDRPGAAVVDQRLGVRPRAGARRRVARVADRDVAASGRGASAP